MWVFKFLNILLIIKTGALLIGLKDSAVLESSNSKIVNTTTPPGTPLKIGNFFESKSYILKKNWYNFLKSIYGRYKQ